MTTDHPAPPPEFSRVVHADRVQSGETIAITADAAERRALAERFELEEIGSLTAALRLDRVRGGRMIRVSGRLEADVVQTCVVSLEAVPARVEERFAALFAPEDMVPELDESFEIDPVTLEDETPEPMDHGRIDLGELTAQHLSLALDPYPRAPGIAFDGPAEHEAPAEGAAELVLEEAEPERPNPFAALAKLKRPD